MTGGAEHYSAQPHRRGRTRIAATVGWDYVHVAIDDATRLAYAEVLADEKARTAIAFLRRAIAFYARYGIRVERLITDNGAPKIDDPRNSLPNARASDISARGPTGRRPTARPSA